MHSCIYEGMVSHRRSEPVTHRFQYRLFMVYLDLDELPSLVSDCGLISSHKFAAQSFQRGDHLFDRSRPLADEVREVVEHQTGQSPSGPIRLLTQLRYCGYYMSPLNLYYCFDERDRHVETIVAEVNNTPWNERHAYVLWKGNRQDGASDLQFSHPKQFHVSPFMAMDMQYLWRLSRPDSSLKVQLANIQQSRQMLDVGMTLQRHELSRSQLRRMTIRHPLMTARIGAAIYLQALKLWWKKCPFYVHPRKPSKSQVPVSTSPPFPTRRTNSVS